MTEEWTKHGAPCRRHRPQDGWGDTACCLLG